MAILEQQPRTGKEGVFDLIRDGHSRAEGSAKGIQEGNGEDKAVDPK